MVLTLTGPVLAVIRETMLDPGPGRPGEQPSIGDGILKIALMASDFAAVRIFLAALIPLIPTLIVARTGIDRHPDPAPWFKVIITMAILLPAAMALAVFLMSVLWMTDVECLW